MQITNAPTDLREKVLREGAEYDAITANDDVLSILGGTEEAVADRNVTKGELVLAGGAAYVASRNIPRGATLVEGMNVVRTDIAELLNQLQSKED